MHLLKPAAPIIVTSRSGCKWPPRPEPKSSSPWLENLTATKANALQNKKIAIWQAGNGTRKRSASRERFSFQHENAEVDEACASHAFALAEHPRLSKLNPPGLQSKRYDEINSQTYWADILRHADSQRERKEN